MRPVIVYLISHAQNAKSFERVVPPMNMKNYAFMPIKNDQAGGSHWSLLVYSRLLNIFFHYDSLNGSNARVAKKVAERIYQFLSVPIGARFVEAETPQQSNGYDCGMYVLKITKSLATRLSGLDNSLTSKIGDDCVFKLPTNSITSEDIRDYRIAIQTQILELFNKS